MPQMRSACFARACALAAAILLALAGLSSCGGGEEEPTRSTDSAGPGNSPGPGTPGENSATLEWNGVVAANLSKYRVYFGLAPGNYIQQPGMGVDAGKDTTYKVTGLSRKTRYYFAVTAVDTSNGESVYSNEVFKDIP